MFAIAYIDDGWFKIRTFTEVPRSSMEEIEKEELDVNKELGLDNHTMPIDNFPDPYITCSFVNDEMLYANLFYNATSVHHSFVYNFKTRKVSSHQTVQMVVNPQNFPYRCFYSEETNEVYSFYR